MWSILPELTNISVLRKSLNLSQKDLSKKCHISQSTISRIENGLEDPPYSKVRAIFDYLENEKMKRKTTSKKIGDLMTKRLIYITPNSKLKKAILLMNEYKISQLPILEDIRNIGSITSKKTQKLIMDNPDLLNVEVLRLKELPFPEIEEDWNLKDVSDILLKYPAVLVKKYDKFIGIITDADLLKNT